MILAESVTFVELGDSRPIPATWRNTTEFCSELGRNIFAVLPSSSAFRDPHGLETAWQHPNDPFVPKVDRVWHSGSRSTDELVKNAAADRPVSGGILASAAFPLPSSTGSPLHGHHARVAQLHANLYDAPRPFEAL